MAIRACSVRLLTAFLMCLGACYAPLMAQNASNTHPLYLNGGVPDTEIPSGLIISRNGHRPLPVSEQQFPLSSLIEGNANQVFPAPPCLTGKYFLGFRLVYDLSDFNTINQWASSLEFQLIYQSDTLWRRNLEVSTKNQVFVANTFLDSAVDCSPDYQWVISAKTDLGQVPESSIYFEVLLYEQEEEVFDPELKPDLHYTFQDEKITVSWNYTGPSVQKFDVEWVAIADHENFQGSTPLEVFEFKEPTGISTENYFYEHLAYYESGRIWYRVRAVGYNPQFPTHRIPAKWSYSTAAPIQIENHQKNKNWLQQTVFAEGGKYKKSMAYADGTSRKRQELTNINSENITVAAETAYDYEGRPSVTILPAPIQGLSLNYKRNLNAFDPISTTVDTHTSTIRKKFHYDNYRSDNSILSDLSGASKYYSANNDLAGIHRDHVPKANGYVYSQVEYLRDGTGRVTRQADAGERFHIDGDHVKRFYYGNASPESLIRLFGRNVGLTNHYKKDLVVDANGQVSISYQNQEGKVIATALAGDNPPNLEALDSYNNLNADPVKVDISSKNTWEAHKSLTVHKILNVTPNTTHDFTYDLSVLGANLTQIGCQECTYTLRIAVADPDGKPLDMSGIQGNESGNSNAYERKNLSAFNCVTPSLTQVSFSLLLTEIGDYTITKELVPKEKSIEELKFLVQQDFDFFIKTLYLLETYKVDSAACEICTSCPEEEDEIDLAIDEIAEQDCENIYQGILHYYQQLYGSATEEPYVVPEDSITAHPDYCQYNLCKTNQKSDVFEKQISRTQSWSQALAKGYDQIVDLDPFFNDVALSGYAHKSTVSAKLNNVYVATIAYDANNDGVQDGTNEYRGTIGEVTDPLNTTFYIDEDGNPSSTGRHILYLDLMGRKAQMTTATYQEELDNQQWSLFKSFYLEAKRSTKQGMSAYTDCPTANQELNYVDDMPQDEQGIEAWGDQNGGYASVSPQELEMTISNLAFNCAVEFSSADSLSIATELEAYFNANPNNFFRFILQPDLGSNPHLQVVENILSNYTCSLDLVAQEDPLQCKEDSAYNLIVNPELNQTSPQNCQGDITESCYEGWAPASGTPNVSSTGGDGRIFLWSYPQDPFSEALRGSLTEPLEKNRKYELCFKYKVFDGGVYNTGLVDHLYIQLSQSKSFTNVSGIQAAARVAASFRSPSDTTLGLSRSGMNLAQANLATCLPPGPTQPDAVWLDGQTMTSEKVWEGTNLSNTTQYQDVCIRFTPSEASTYFYLSLMSCETNGYQAINIEDLNIRKISPRPGVINFEGNAICLEYDTDISSLAAFDYTVDWNKEVALCQERATEENTILFNYALEKLLEEETSTLRTVYETNCQQNVQEKLVYSSAYKEYHHTLYYYDQSGHLVQTVPPQGVHPLTPSQVEDFLAGQKIDPSHQLASIYSYNSIDQLIRQQTPDAGEMNFWYNRVGQLRLSQSAEQAKEHEYSYSKYDRQGRTIEVGEIETNLPLADLTAALEDPEFPLLTEYSAKDITRTFYDLANPIIRATFDQEQLRNRVSWVEVIDSVGARANATFYSYDIHGNVKALLQDIDGLGHKRIDYRYDLISGNLNDVFYQYNEPDQLIHHYQYDADNRITEVYTSTDGHVWDKEASYVYYQHGPLARLTLGQYHVQGIDYYYTLQGWLKGVNMPYADDPGSDGINGSRVGQDAYAYALGYYKGDYQPLIGSVPEPGQRDGLWNRLNEQLGNEGLYNGNISWMVTDLPALAEKDSDRAKGMQAMLYGYDQLNRITKAKSLVNYSVSTGFDSRQTTAQAYDTDYSYDANGNLLMLNRHDDQGGLQDQFNYQYYAGTNRLKYIKPIIRDTVYNGGQIRGNKKVYRNIAVGNSAYAGTGSAEVIKAINSIDMSPDFKNEPNAQFRAYVLSDDEGAYVYDANGNLIADQDEGITIEWTAYGKVRAVQKSDSTGVSFRYDGMGNRLAKRVQNKDSIFTTHYVRDAAGEVMAIYKDSTLIEQPIYGSQRLGLYRGGRLAAHRNLGGKTYELGNHLGNVLVTLSDSVLMTADSTLATVTGTFDYYPFGLAMEGRSIRDSLYRYGFNGMEKDGDGEFGNGTTYTTLFRQYDPRIGRWLSVDPLTKNFAWQSPYVGVDNKPIIRNDINGDCPTCGAAAAGAVVGALMDMIIQVGEHMYNGDDMQTAIQKIDYVSVSKEAGIGALAGVSGFGAARYIKKAMKVLKSPAGRAAMVFLAEQGVDMAVSSMAEYGFEASGMEASLYGALGFSHMSNKAIGDVGEKSTREFLTKQYGDGFKILEQVEGSFEDGTKTVFDFAVVDKKGKIVQLAESKANTGRFTSQQKRYWNSAENVNIDLGNGSKSFNVKRNKSITYRWKVNKFTGTSTYRSAKNFMSGIISRVKK